MLLCPSEQRRNILSVSYGRLTSHLVTGVDGVLLQIYFGEKTLIGRYSTNIAPQNIKRVAAAVVVAVWGGGRVRHNEKFPQH